MALKIEHTVLLFVYKTKVLTDIHLRSVFSKLSYLKVEQKFDFQ